MFPIGTPTVQPSEEDELLLTQRSQYLIQHARENIAKLKADPCPKLVVRRLTYAEDTLANEEQSLAKLSTANKYFGHTTPFYEFCATNETSLWGDKGITSGITCC